MMALAILVVNICLATGSDVQTYREALAEAQQQKQPLLVLVGANWCPACRTMEQHVLPELRRRGALAGVSLAKVDADHQPDLARQLMRGDAIPQLIVFSPRQDGSWYRAQLTGAASEREVSSLVLRAREQLLLSRPDSRPVSAIGN